MTRRKARGHINPHLAMKTVLPGSFRAFPIINLSAEPEKYGPKPDLKCSSRWSYLHHLINPFFSLCASHLVSCLLRVTIIRLMSRHIGVILNSALSRLCPLHKLIQFLCTLLFRNGRIMLFFLELSSASTG